MSESVRQLFWSVVLVLGMVALVAFGAGALAQLGEDEHLTCAEDEVPVEVLEDSFEWDSGDTTCIHIERLRGDR